jgi:superfamily I DNA/RNA helicase
MSAEISPTPEQQEIINAFVRGEDIVVDAAAGSGKTTLLKMCALAAPHKKVLYIPFDTETQKRAKSSMPSNVNSMTFHAMARSQIISKLEGELGSYQSGVDYFTIRAYRFPKEQLEKGVKDPYLRDSHSIADYFNIKNPIFLESSVEETGTNKRYIRVLPSRQVYLAKKILSSFCNSGDQDLQVHHFFREYLFSPELFDVAKKMWADIVNYAGKMHWSYDYYAKLWACYCPDLSSSGYDAIFIDEAQDTNPLQMQVYESQTLQKVYVGDPRQSIYQFRGSFGAMSKLSYTKYPLTESFRFGPGIAKAAKKVYSKSNIDVDIKGRSEDYGVVRSEIDNPNTILARGNSTIVELAVVGQGMYKDSRLWVPTKTRKALLLLVKSLMWFLYEQPKDPFKPSEFDDELRDYLTLSELEEAISNEEVRSTVKNLLDRLKKPGGHSSVVESLGLTKSGRKLKGVKYVEIRTVHSAKGGEWDRVQLADDFASPKSRTNHEGKEVLTYPREEELNIIYTAITRAKSEIGLGASAWIFDS